MSSLERIGFVGAGRMGANMARRLKDCGYAVTALYDAHQPSAESLAAELGAFSATHAAKDSTIAWVLGCEAGLSLPLAAATKLQYDRLVALGRGGLDKSAVAELTFPGRA